MAMINRLKSDRPSQMTAQERHSKLRQSGYFSDYVEPQRTVTAPTKSLSALNETVKANRNRSLTQGQKLIVARRLAALEDILELQSAQPVPPDLF